MDDEFIGCGFSVLPLLFHYYYFFPPFIFSKQEDGITFISSHRLLPEMCTIQIKIRTMLLVLFHNSTSIVCCYFFSTTSCLTLIFPS